MIVHSVDRDKLTNFVREIGIAAEKMSLREEMQDIRKKIEIKKEKTAKQKIERKADKNKEEIKKLKQSIKKIEIIFKASQKKKHDKKIAKRIKFRLDVLQHRLKELEKKK